MKIGDIANASASQYGKPLEGVRVLAAEQMQALPYATQLLGRLGADVVKVEHPVNGESGRGAMPAMTDPDGRRVGATFLRNNFSKRSVGLDLKSERGRELFKELAGKFDIVGENFTPGTMDRLGLGYSALSELHPSLIYVSVSGFGNTDDTPYKDWPAYACVAEAMSGLYEYSRQPGQPPQINPSGALGDIASALYATIGVLAALRHRDRTGLGQHVDIAMFDAMVAMADLVPNWWSMGMEFDPEKPRPKTGLINAFRASDGWFVIQIAREHQFERLARIIGHDEWLTDERLATRAGWGTHLEDIIRPGLEGWAASLTKLDAATALSGAGVASAPCFAAVDVVNDPHVAAHHMLVEMPRTDGVEQPVLVPGNPVKLSKMAEGPELRVPWLGEHTDDVLAAELGLDTAALTSLRADGVIN